MATAVASLPVERNGLKPRFIRVKEGANYCGLSESELYRAIYAGELKALRYKSRSWLLTREDIDAWIAAQSVSSVA